MISETSRFSALAGQHVHGEISERTFAAKCPDGGACHAFGWYTGPFGKGAKGTAYYWQDDVNKAEDSSLSYAAAHEVCHSLTGAPHDAAHAQCTKDLLGYVAAAASSFRCFVEVPQ